MPKGESFLRVSTDFVKREFARHPFLGSTVAVLGSVSIKKAYHHLEDWDEAFIDRLDEWRWARQDRKAAQHHAELDIMTASGLVELEDVG